MTRIMRGICLCVLFGSVATAFAEQIPNEKAQLEREVARILRQSNIDIRYDIKKVFALGDIYLEEANSTKALYYYLEGLKSDAWNLVYQLKAAKLLHQYNRNDEAVEKAMLVYEFSEQKDLIAQAESLLSELNHLIEKDSTSASTSQVTIMLVPVGDINPYLLSEVVLDLQKTLGVRYVINDSIKINLGKPDRPYAHRYIERIYKDLREKLPDSDFKEYRVKAGTLITTLDQYESQKKFVTTVFKDAFPKEKMTEFETTLSEMENDGQYHATRLLKLLQSKVQLPKDGTIKGCIGVTNEDIYASDYNFLFGQAMGNFGVMSYHRFTADFNDAIPNRKKLKERTLKQLISSSFFVFSIPRCSNPTCARAYPNSLEEHDRKENKPCDECMDKWKKKIKMN